MQAPETLPFQNRRTSPCSIVQVGRVVERAAGGAVRLFVSNQGSDRFGWPVL